VALAGIGAASVAAGSVRVSVGTNGVRVRPGILPLALVRLPLDRIQSAQAIDVRPMQWGGWGYRGSLRFATRAAWVVRGGPGLRVDLRDGSTFVVTVDDADHAAAALNALLGAARAR
jgi:hypothetical protein